MEWVIILSLVAAYSSLSAKLDKIIDNQNETKKSKKMFHSLNELIGKNISIETSDELDLTLESETKGILRDFNDKWIIIETINKKNKKELYYYRISNIVSIDIIEK